MSIFSPASRAAIVLVVCPKCEEAQARAAFVAGDAYECRKCHHLFSKAAGLEAAKAQEDAKRPRR